MLLLLVSKAPGPPGSAWALECPGGVSRNPESKPEAGLWSEPLGAAWVGAEQHLVTGGSLGPAALLLAQELLEPVGGEGERLAAQLHQVGVLQPWVG